MRQCGAMRSISEYTHVQGSCPLANIVSFTSKAGLKPRKEWICVAPNFTAPARTRPRLFPSMAKIVLLPSTPNERFFASLICKVGLYIRFINPPLKLTTVAPDYFLHPARQPSPVGRNVVPATIKMINAFRKNGITIAWTNVCLCQYHIA